MQGLRGDSCPSVRRAPRFLQPSLFQWRLSYTFMPVHLEQNIARQVGRSDNTKTYKYQREKVAKLQFQHHVSSFGKLILIPLRAIPTKPRCGMDGRARARKGPRELYQTGFGPVTFDIWSLLCCHLFNCYPGGVFASRIKSVCCLWLCAWPRVQAGKTGLLST